MCKKEYDFCMNFGFFNCCINCNNYADINCPYYKTKLTKINTLIDLYIKSNHIKIIKP